MAKISTQDAVLCTRSDYMLVKCFLTEFYLNARTSFTLLARPTSMRHGKMRLVAF